MAQAPDMIIRIDGPIPPPVERLLTATEVAARFGVSKAWVSAHASGARQPALPSIRLGRSVRFAPRDIEQFLQQNRRAAA